MELIPKPEVLDPNRVLRDDREEMTAAEHRNQAQLLDGALHQSCDYAGQLWDTLESVREYLYASLPAAPSTADRPDADQGRFAAGDDSGLSKAGWTSQPL